MYDEKFKEVEKLLKTGTWRKYEIQDILKLTRGEVDMILSELTRKGYVESTSLGWRWKRDA